MAVCFSHRAEGMSVWEGIAFEGCPGRGETQNSSNIFRKIPARELTTPENQQAELDRLILQLQELSKHVAMRQLYRLNRLLGGWDERGAGLVSPGAVVSLLTTAMWLQGSFCQQRGWPQMSFIYFPFPAEVCLVLWQSAL